MVGQTHIKMKQVIKKYGPLLLITCYKHFPFYSLSFTNNGLDSPNGFTIHLWTVHGFKNNELVNMTLVLKTRQYQPVIFSLN